ncbi:MAG: hydroxyacid dehydrogenase [Herminiimonas sp.]|nr:hydroxyacid dehydrogenase [Herminiimonas sp.]
MALTQDGKPLHVLLSEKAEADFGGRIAEVLAGRPHRFVHPDHPVDADGDIGADLALLTRDVTGLSTKALLTPATAHFYALLRKARSLQWVHSHSAGADRPIFGELRQRGVTVTTSSGANAEPVAQTAVAGLLALSRCFPSLMAAQRRAAWEPLLGPRAPKNLRGQVAIVVGLGPVGLEIASLLKALHLNVIGVRREPQPCPPCDTTIGFADLSTALPRADWLVLACPLTSTTEGMIDAAAMARMPAGARIVNVARGEVIVEKDLVAALQSGHLGGAFLDVFEHEPLAKDSPLWAMENVIATPHSAGHAAGNNAAVGEIFLDNLARWRDGKALRNTVP